MKVLIVDDTPENVYMLETLLKGNGYAVSTAMNGKEALERLKQEPANLIISDILMPKMDGFQLCRAVKADDALKHTPFIFYTATYTTEKDRDFALSLGADRFILKPADPDEFISIIKKVLTENETGLLKRGEITIENETEYLKGHQARLINKLEDKISQFERSEGRYQSLISSAIDAIITLDESGLITSWNEAAKNNYGYTPDEVIGKSFALLIPEEFRSPQNELFERLRKKELPARLEIVVKSKNADLIPVGTSFSLMRDKQGRVLGFSAIIRDMTEFKRTEEKLRENELRLRTLLKTIPDMVWLKDVHGTYLACNPKFERFFGAKETDIIDRTDYDFVKRDLADVFREHDRKVMAAGKSSSQEDWITFADDGRRVLMDTIKTPMYDAAGNLIGVLGIARDITDRKRAEESIAASEEQFRKLYQEFHGLLDAVPDSLMLLDKNLKVLWANRVAADFMGADPEALTGQYCHSLWYKRMTHCEPCPVMESFSTGKALSVTVTRPDGRVFDIRTVPLNDETGGIARVIEVVRDITEHRKLEAQYLQAQKMESIGTLAGGVAHDFNNILSAIIGYGHVTLMKMAGDDPLRMNIEHMLEAADRATYLTKSLLLFSRKQITERKPVDLNEMVRKVEIFLKRVIGEDIECKTTLSDKPIPILADGHQLEQILMNLAVNARDAMPGGGAFSVKTEQIDLAEDFTRVHGYGRSGVYAMITISDTGMGMDETTRTHIFEPFFTTKEVGKGTGLGLAVVYGIIKDHEGFINVYSEPGKGTTFRIYLPIIGTSITEETKAQHREAPARGTETVLVAEDDDNLRKLSRTVLTEYGYTVIEAFDGEDAVKKFMENKDTIKLLLFDLIMPKLNGKEASDEIRKIKPDMKVLFASGYDPDLVQQKMLLEAGVNLVYKPISPMDLLRKVRSVLDEATQ